MSGIVPEPSGFVPASVVGVLEEVWSSTVVACEGIDDRQWELPTDCPGWTVRDQLSHLIGIERSLLGDPAPALDGPVPPHVRNSFGEMNEAWVAARRAVPGPEVLAEFRSVAGQRLDVLRSMPPERFDEVGWSPVGQVPYREFMEVRAFDCWAHEQDVRRALGRPGGLGGAGEAITLGRVVSTLGFVVGRKVGPPDGTSVVWRVTGPSGSEHAVVMEGGRGRAPAAIPVDPDVLLVMGADTFWRLGCGRVPAAEVLATGDATISGDAALGRRVLESMAVTP